MDLIEKAVADFLCKILKVTDPAKVAAVEAAAPKIVDAAESVFGAIRALRAK